ncbi:uncharacterized protein LOC123659644 [Melitaea cinxia]|uniref:uncharacterized protein LOC123659644 n=1 Tax=Melitaea cinxia TaxID=113334 RepID=UPI001E273A8A|nr:uncharacterized protein LOC123659644 [Melitaea cinxia]
MEGQFKLLFDQMKIEMDKQTNIIFEKQKRNLKEVYVTEDFPKEILERRRELQPKLKEERAKGNFAYIKYDQLIVKEGNINKEKRKREQSTSPENYNCAKKLVSDTPSIKENMVNSFKITGNRLNSLSQEMPNQNK